MTVTSATVRADEDIRRRVSRSVEGLGLDLSNAPHTFYR